MLPDMVGIEPVASYHQLDAHPTEPPRPAMKIADTAQFESLIDRKPIPA